MKSAEANYTLAGQKHGSAHDFVEALLTAAVQRVNSGVSKTLTARRTSERPPRDSRHLTDTRTRVSTLLEYSLAYEMNHILVEDKAGYSVSAVLWNVFPDLIIRDSNRENLLGLEVKALHTAAEEKSANFMTPLQIVRQHRDFIIIISWGWYTNELEGAQVTYPYIHASGVFDAWLLAKIRDYGWLFKQGGRIKGIDLATPIINGGGNRFKAEEGNRGKLMRIQLPDDLPGSVPNYPELLEENKKYSTFKSLVLALGLRETFVDLCTLEGATNVQVAQPEGYPTECRILGEATRNGGRRIYLIAGNRPEQWLRAAGVDATAPCFWLSSKLNWRIYAKKGERWEVKGEGAKPDSDYESIKRVLDNL